MSPRKRPPGRPANYVNDQDGKPIVGLSYHKATDRYYASHSHPRVYFGSDYHQAVFRFRRWEAQQKGEPFTGANLSAVVTADLAKRYQTAPEDDRSRFLLDLLGFEFGEHDADLLASPQVVETLADGSVTAHDGAFRLDESKGEFVQDARVDLENFWQRLADFIRTDPKRFAGLVGIDEIGWLHKIKAPAPALSLEALSDLYQNSPRVSQARKDEAKKFWTSFKDAMGCQALDGISAERMRAYRDGLLTSDRNPSYVQKIFKAVKAILNNGAKEGLADDHLSRVITLAKMLRLPDTSSVNGSDPHPIEPADFKKLLAVATDPLDRAILLVGLNCSYYPIDVSRLPVDAVQLDKGMVIFKRQKTGGTTRVACLWKETTASIKAYRKAYPHQAETLFVSSHGKPLSTATIVARFNALREGSGLPDSITFSWLRDGCTCAQAAGVNGELIDVQLGHRLPGQRDKYIKRDPSMVKPVADAMHRHYFAK